ncbi:MAG TPA: carbohydrate kinase [Roseiflexaceae bacterium]|nr:carbohydrate kinase [Roseiflexaceae bacterium]
MRQLLTSMGELLIDFLPITDHGQTTGFSMYPGGSPMNVALGFARLGQPAAFAGGVSRDFFGRTLRSFLDKEGVDTRFLIDIDAPSTLSFVAIEHDEPAYTFYGEGAADTLYTPELISPALYAETRALHVGSISLLRAPTADAVVAACEALHGKALISFDPNIRAGLIGDEASYRQRIERILGLADLVKISVVDLAWLLPNVPVEAAAAQLLAHGAALVVITLGGDGIMAWRHGEAPVHVPVFPVQLADTIGAGDTVDAGLLVGLAERDALTRAALTTLARPELEATLRFAAAAAAITCQRVGADLPRRADVAALLGETGT